MSSINVPGRQHPLLPIKHEDDDDDDGFIPPGVSLMAFSKSMGDDGEVVKIRSFRDEDYCNRRVFLRSYPLQWEDDEVMETEEEEEEEEMMASYSKVSVKSKFIALIQWGEGKVVFLRRLKNKMAFYFVSCHSFGFRHSNKLIAF